HVDTGNSASLDVFAHVTMNAPPGTPVDTDGAAGGSVTEGAALGTTVGITAHATNSDGDPISYSLTDNAGGRFVINATTGVVTVSTGGAGTIDYESAPGHAYTITVAASDGIATKTQDFTIAVVNVAPATPVDVNGTVVEGAAAGTAVGITASSSGPNSAVTYSLVDD